MTLFSTPHLRASALPLALLLLPCTSHAQYPKLSPADAAIPLPAASAVLMQLSRT